MPAISNPRAAAAMACLTLGLLAGGVFVVQVRSAECDWSSAIGDWDSAHAFAEGSEPSWWLFFASTLLFTASVVIPVKWWVGFLLALPVWLMALFVLFVAMTAMNPCTARQEPKAATSAGAHRGPVAEDERIAAASLAVSAHAGDLSKW